MPVIGRPRRVGARWQMTQEPSTARRACTCSYFRFYAGASWWNQRTILVRSRARQTRAHASDT